MAGSLLPLRTWAYAIYLDTISLKGVSSMYIGGLERNKHEKDKKRLGRSPVGKTAVVGAKDRESNRVVARVIERTDRETLQGFVDDHASSEARVYTVNALGGGRRSDDGNAASGEMFEPLAGP